MLYTYSLSDQISPRKPFPRTEFLMYTEGAFLPFGIIRPKKRRMQRFIDGKFEAYKKLEKVLSVLKVRVQ